MKEIPIIVVDAESIDGALEEILDAELSHEQMNKFLTFLESCSWEPFFSDWWESVGDMIRSYYLIHGKGIDNNENQAR